MNHSQQLMYKNFQEDWNWKARKKNLELVLFNQTIQLVVYLSIRKAAFFKYRIRKYWFFLWLKSIISTLIDWHYINLWHRLNFHSIALILVLKTIYMLKSYSIKIFFSKIHSFFRVLLEINNLSWPHPHPQFSVINSSLNFEKKKSIYNSVIYLHIIVFVNFSNLSPHCSYYCCHLNKVSSDFLTLV
jgi:hypothetical protein